MDRQRKLQVKFFDRIDKYEFMLNRRSCSLYVYSLSVALQALTVISMGSIADDRTHLLSFYSFVSSLTVFSSALHRKRLLLTFAFLGAAAAALFLLLPSSSPVWLLSASLAVLANVGFGASVVAMNAYLPSLAKISPEVVLLLEELENTTYSVIDNPDEDAINE